MKNLGEIMENSRIGRKTTTRAWRNVYEWE